MSIDSHLDRRIYVWAVSPQQARAKAKAILGKGGIKPPYPEMRATPTGLRRPGSMVNDRTGDAFSMASRRYAVDVIV